MNIAISCLVGDNRVYTRSGDWAPSPMIIGSGIGGGAGDTTNTNQQRCRNTLTMENDKPLSAEIIYKTLSVILQFISTNQCRT